MKITLLTHTPDPETVVAVAAHQCVSNDDAVEFHKALLKKHPKHSNKIFRRALEQGHESILEHVSFTFAISGVSRSLSHQLVRARIASFSQQSQRYVTIAPGEFASVVPPSIQAQPGLLEQFEDFMVDVAQQYDYFVKAGIPAEDARFILPNATETALIMTMNARELRHMFNLRCCTHAQWEIRTMFGEILRLVKRVAPSLFENAGASCVSGPCPEGSRSCGRDSGQN